MLLLFCGAFTAQTGRTDVTRIDALLKKARRNGDVRVIITLQQPTLPERASMSEGEYDGRLAQAIASLQSAVSNRMSKQPGVGHPTRFPFTAQYAATVTEAGLDALAHDPSVMAIAEDRADPALLDESVPWIFSSHATSPYSGHGWTIAIVDTGVDKHHSFLRGKVVSEACYSTTNPVRHSTSVCPGGAPSSTASGSGLPCLAPGCAHGTHVAGIASGNGDTLTGVARDAGIIAIQAFSQLTDPTCSEFGARSPCILSWHSDQIRALQRVYALRTTFNIAAVNMSLGGGAFASACDNDPRKATIDALKSAGIATVVAAGNGGLNNALSAPACISTSIAVGSTAHTDIRSSFSNNGGQLDLYAPGQLIYSSLPGGGFRSWSGTSMATPHVAGAWAVMKQNHPSLSVDGIETAFKGTGVTVTSFGIPRQRIDIDQALAFYANSGFSFSPLVPCRIVDTRKAGGRIPTGATRDFLVWGGETEMQRQGGSGDCGVPLDAAAVILNITSFKPSSDGHFRIYPFGVNPPNASILNFQSGQTLANSTTTPVCQPVCLFDITVLSTTSSHLIIDVMGFMQ